MLLVRGTGRGESGRTVCRQYFLGTSFEFADLAPHSNDCSLYTCNTASGVDIIPPQRVTLAIGSEEHHKRTSSPIAATAPPVGGDGAAGGTVTAAPAAGAAPAAAAAGAGAAADPE